ncbi:MAG: protein kinase [Pirellulales bacterium]|nr:protein kinase [Pirellulales bacterium]
MTSSSRSNDASSGGTQPHDERVVLRPGGGGPDRDDQQTVISNRPPLSPGSADSADGQEPGNLRPGDVVGHYQILDYVGGGGMGRVFRAQDTQLDRLVALKVLPREQAADEETLRRFRNEARSGARLDHQNIARVYHVGEDQGFPYLVFEFVDGPTIRALVEQRGPLTLAEAISYTLQVADALAHAAGHDVVHRDIKPSNLIVTGQGRVKVIDMGLARIQQDDAGTDLTASGVTLGTFDYISPEQARDPRVVDTRSDIYSLGCAFFYMLSGRPPFPEGTVLQKLLQHQGDKPPDIRVFRPELPDEVSRVLEKMLAKDPNHRYQTAMELVEQLQWLAEQLGLQPLRAGQSIWSVPRKASIPFWQRHFPWMAPVAALVCIVLALTALWHFPATTETEAPLLASGNLAVESSEKPASTPREEPAVPPDAGAPAVGDSARPFPSPSEKSLPANTDSPADANRSLSPRPNRTNPAASGPDGVNGTPSPEAIPNGASSLLAGRGPWNAPEPTSGMEISIDPAVLPESISPGDLRLPSVATGVLTVGRGDGNARDYPTLSAACAAAQTDDIIELCYNGARKERPIDLPNAKLTIRAGQNYHPVVLFQPDQDDPVEYHRSMFTLAGGEATIIGVIIEMHLPRELSGSRWTLWELGEGARLSLRQSVMTVANPYGQDAAVFRTKSSPALELVRTRVAIDTLMPVEISLTDCVIRGQAVMLLEKSLQPVRFDWTNGLLATNEWLVCVLGGDRNPEPGEMIELRLKHVTARVDKGLCLLDDRRMAPCQLPVRIECSDSLVVMASSQGALVEQFGEHPTNLEEPWFTWTGNRNGYQGVSVFWRVNDTRPGSAAKQFDFDQWREHWPEQEIHSRVGTIDFAVPFDSSRPVNAAHTTDFRLGNSPENWARGGASDGSDLGAAIDRLPANSDVSPWPAILPRQVPAWMAPINDILHPKQAEPRP